MLTESERYRVWFGGITAGSFVAMTQLLAGDSLNLGREVALGCFAFTLPVATVFTIWPRQYPIRKQPEKIRESFASVGAILTMVFGVGVGALFYSFGILFGAIFTIGTFVAIAFGSTVAPIVDKQSTKPGQDAQQADPIERF